MSGSDLDLHDGDEIIQILDHLSRLLRIDSMSMRFMLLCMQDIELSPGVSVWKRAVVGDEKPTTQAQRALVGTNAHPCTAKSQDGRTNETPLLKDLAQSLIHLL